MNYSLGKFPHWVAVIGQSGSGKGTVAELLKKIAEEAGLSILSISTGDEIRKCLETKTYFSEKMRAINDSGKRQPNLIAASLWLNKMFKELQEGQHILLEGAPRYVEQFKMMQSLVDVGYIDSLKVLEILTPENICLERLAERTIKDKRLDLSIEGQPGMPDLEKIKTKMQWWTDDRDLIVQSVQESGAYLSIENTGTVKDAEDQLRELFFVL